MLRYTIPFKASVFIHLIVSANLVPHIGYAEFSLKV